MAECWWRMRTPSEFVDAFVPLSEEIFVIAVPCPARRIPGLPSEIDRRFSQDGARITKKFVEEMEDEGDPAEFLLTTFGIEETALDPIADMVDGLRDHVIIGYTGTWRRWEKFSRTYAQRIKAGRYVREYSLPRFILLIPRECADQNFDGWCIRNLPAIRSLDLEIFASLLEQEHSEEGLALSFRIQLIKHVSGPDPVLAAYLHKLPTKLLAAPWSHLAMCTTRGIGYETEDDVDNGFPFADPSWDGGTLSRLDGDVAASGMSVAAIDTGHQRRFRIWRAALQTFLPFIFLETQRFINDYQDFLVAPWPRDARKEVRDRFDVIQQVEHLELAQIATQMEMSGVFDSEIPSYLRLLTKLRNQIAHYNKLDDWLLSEILEKERIYRSTPALDWLTAQIGHRNLEAERQCFDLQIAS